MAVSLKPCEVSASIFLQKIVHAAMKRLVQELNGTPMHDLPFNFDARGRRGCQLIAVD